METMRCELNKKEYPLDDLRYDGFKVMNKWDAESNKRDDFLKHVSSGHQLVHDLDSCLFLDHMAYKILNKLGNYGKSVDGKRVYSAPSVELTTRVKLVKKRANKRGIKNEGAQDTEDFYYF